MTDTPTIAQETITIAMLTGFLTCIVATYGLIQLYNPSPVGYVVLTIMSFIVAGYLIPNLTAAWMGRTLDDIFDDTSHQYNA